MNADIFDNCLGARV